MKIKGLGSAERSRGSRPAPGGESLTAAALRTKKKITTAAWCVGNSLTLGSFIWTVDRFAAWQRRKFGR